jgi:hypothetical protein
VHKNEYTSNALVCVRLTEYDQELSLPLNLLRDLSAFSVDDLIQPAQFILYYIDGVYSPTGWSPDLLPRLESLMTNNKISLKPTFQCRNCNFARVYVNDVNVAELINKNGQGCIIESNKLMVVADEYFRRRETGVLIDVLGSSLINICVEVFQQHNYHVSQLSNHKYIRQLKTATQRTPISDLIK